MRDPATMTASEINRELERLSKVASKLNDEMLATGRGHEKPTETRYKTDSLSERWKANADRMYELRVEVETRMGPGHSRLPAGRGFGPRKRLEGFGGNVTKPKIKLPSRAAVVKELRGIQREMERGEVEEDNYIDVRLQVYEDGEWLVHYGDPSFDTDHRGYWGAGSVGIDADGKELEDVAEQLIEEAAESMAQDDTESVGSARYSVVVGNIGTVYDGDSRVKARHTYDTYVGDSKDNHGRAAGESVTLFEDGEIIAEHHGEGED